jgi:hypothetical protein
VSSLVAPALASASVFFHAGWIRCPVGHRPGRGHRTQRDLRPPLAAGGDDVADVSKRTVSVVSSANSGAGTDTLFTRTPTYQPSR